MISFIASLSDSKCHTNSVISVPVNGKYLSRRKLTKNHDSNKVDHCGDEICTVSYRKK